MIVGIGWLIKVKITGNYLIDRIFGIVSMGYALLTFSRGGVVNPLFAIVFGIFALMYRQRSLAVLGRIFLITIVMFLVGILLWNYVNQATNGFLAKRYEKTVKKKINGGETGLDVEEDKVDFSGREDLTKVDLEIFMEHPIMGLGPGCSKFVRQEKLHKFLPAHTEYTRLLAEHGVFGITALIFLIFYPIVLFSRKIPTEGSIFTTIMLTFTYFAISHTDMRVVMPSFCFGIAFANYIPNVVKRLARSEDNDKEL